jgi:hypothetical protein
MTANHPLLPIADRIRMDRSRPEAVTRAAVRLRADAPKPSVAKGNKIGGVGGAGASA